MYTRSIDVRSFAYLKAITGIFDCLWYW